MNRFWEGGDGQGERQGEIPYERSYDWSLLAEPYYRRAAREQLAAEEEASRAQAKQERTQQVISEQQGFLRHGKPWFLAAPRAAGDRRALRDRRR